MSKRQLTEAAGAYKNSSRALPSNVDAVVKHRLAAVEAADAPACVAVPNADQPRDRRMVSGLANA